MDKNKIVVDPNDFADFINKNQKNVKAFVQEDGSINIEENNKYCKDDEHDWEVEDVLTTAVIICVCKDCGAKAQFVRQL